MADSPIRVGSTLTYFHPAEYMNGSIVVYINEGNSQRMFGWISEKKDGIYVHLHRGPPAGITSTVDTMDEAKAWFEAHLALLVQP